VKAGVKRCYGIVGDALNPVIDALRRNGRIEFIHVRHEEYGVLAAVAEAYLTDNPVVVCGTAGPGPLIQWADGCTERGGSNYCHRGRCRDERDRHI
jgi:glyoxylate carboligase